MKRLIALLCAVLLLCGCSGIPNAVRRGLAKPEKYTTSTGILLEIRSGDEIRLRVSFDDPEEVRKYLDGGSNSGDLPSWSGFQVVGANMQALEDSGFFDEVPLGSTVTIHASNFIYMDGEQFYIAAISCDGKEYLSFEVGFQNIQDYLEQN